MKTDFEYIVLGLGGFGSAAAYWLARRAGTEVLGLEQFELGHVRGESQDHSRIIRLSYHTPGYVELAKFAYQAWAELERDSGEQLVLRTGGLDLGPRRERDPAQHLQRQHGRGRRAVRAARRRRDHAALAPVAPHRRHARPLPGAERHRDGGAGQRRPRADGAGARRHAARPHAGRGDPPGRRRGRGPHRGGDLPLPAAGGHRRGLVQPRRSRSVGLELPLRVTKEQVTYFASPRAGRLPAGPVPDLDLDGRSLLLRLPRVRRGGAQGGPGRRRAGDHAATPGPSSPTARRSTAWSASSRGTCPARWGRSSTPRPVSTRSRPTATSCSTCCRSTRRSRWRSAAATASSSPRWWASILSDLSIDGHSPRDLAPFRIDRPILQLKDPPRNYMV